MAHQHIHPTASIHPSAQLGEGVTIGPGVSIAAGVVIGEGCAIHHGAFIDENTVMGKHNQVFPYAVIGTPPQDIKFRGEKSGVVLGDRNVVREFCTINRASGEGENTTVGNGCFLLITSHIGHNSHLGNGVVLTNQVSLGGHMEISDNVTFGGMSGAHQFVRVGRLAMIGGYSALLNDVPPFMLVKGGYRAGIFRINSVGLQRSGVSDDTIHLLQQALDGPMHQLNEKNPDYAKVSAEVAALGPAPEVQELADFLKQPTKRGYCTVIDRAKRGDEE